MTKSLSVVRVREWGQYAWLRHGFSTRGGGVSTVYSGDGAAGELNLGWTKEDDPSAVVQNRELLVRAVGEGPECRLVTVRQVHGIGIQTVGAEVFDGVFDTAEGKAVMEGDGLVTKKAGVLLGIQTADCVPVLVVDVRQRVVGAFHAGWRGTVARIVEQGVEAMGAKYGSRVADLTAAVGPSIGVCCYEVGDEVKAEFGRAFAYGEDLFRGKRLDLWEANRLQLVAAGVRADRIAVVGECTACTRDDDGRRRYFSHRDEKGFSGRMLSLVGSVE